MRGALEPMVQWLAQQEGPVFESPLEPFWAEFFHSHILQGGAARLNTEIPVLFTIYMKSPFTKCNTPLYTDTVLDFTFGTAHLSLCNRRHYWKSLWIQKSGHQIGTLSQVNIKTTRQNTFFTETKANVHSSMKCYDYFISNGLWWGYDDILRPPLTPLHLVYQPQLYPLLVSAHPFINAFFSEKVGHLEL